MKVAIQGQKNSFHDVARRQFFGSADEIVACESFKEVFETLAKDEADVAVVAMENSLYGSINEVYDLVLKSKFWIGGEVYLHIEHCLIGTKASSVETISEIHSHPVALAQCEDYLSKHLPKAERFEHHDTAGSAVDVSAWNNPTKASIASLAAAEDPNLRVLVRNIETNKHNYTRFIILYPNRQSASSDYDKSSLVLFTGHKPGALHRALGGFADRHINLSKLESRPIVGTRWEYMFYVDIEAGIEDSRTITALEELSKNGQTVKVLGSFKRSQLPDLNDNTK